MKEFFITTQLAEFLNKNNLNFILEVVRSMQNTFIVAQEEFQVWIFRRVENDKFSFTLEDGNKNQILSLFYTSETIRIDELTVWFSNSVLYFPSEH